RTPPTRSTSRGRRGIGRRPTAAARPAPSFAGLTGSGPSQGDDSSRTSDPLGRRVISGVEGVHTAATKGGPMARYGPAKRAKELKRKARQEAKAARKRERKENPGATSPDADIDWSQAVGMPGSESTEEPAGDDAEAEAEAES